MCVQIVMCLIEIMTQMILIFLLVLTVFVPLVSFVIVVRGSV